VLALAMPVLVGPASAATAADPTMRIRIAWGGGPERLWQGRVAIGQGTLADPVPLGIEADEEGSMWLERGQFQIAALRTGKPSRRGPVETADGYLAIRQWSRRTYDGVDLTVQAPLQASLFVELVPADENQQAGWVEARLADLVHGKVSAELDERGTRLVICRSPGDELRIELPRRSLVFEPGEALECTLRPHLLPMEPGSKVQIKVQLLAARSSRELWSAEYWMVLGETESLPLKVPLRKEEGAYDVVLTATQDRKLRLPQPARPQLGLRSPVVERTIQVLVLNPRPETPPIKEERLSVVEEIDPANPKWWAKFANLPHLPRLQRMWKGPLSSGHWQTVQHPLGTLVQLAPNAKAGETSWEAYTLPIQRPGEPHVLEVDYPSDVPQTLAISVVEPNAAGAVVPIGLDSGVDRAEEIGEVAAAPQWLRHRLIFWPRTKTPIVLVANRRDQTPATYGKIRVLSGWKHLPRAFPPGADSPERLLAAYLDRPLLHENFTASEALDSSTDRSFDDWSTFYEAGTRLVEYLHHVGYNALVLSVFADGSTIYPSSVVQPTPRYDTGIFFETGQDPIRKDVLGMLLRMFDREGLQLIPTLEFGSPLAELEAVLRRGGPAAEGIQWIGPDGSPWEQQHTPQRGRAPYYNVLHPRVQETILSVVHELVEGYAQHPSFAGLALQLSADGYTQLPGPEWGLDDVTIALFERDTKIQLPEEGPDRFAQRASRLSHPTADGRREWRREWLGWRAMRLAQFYRRIQAELNAVRPGARLYLAGAELLAGEAAAEDLRPSLLRRSTAAEALLHAGIDVHQYGQRDRIVLLRPERIAPQSSLVRRAIDLELAQMPDWDRYFQLLPPSGSLFSHPPQELRLASFEEKSPFRPCYARLYTHATPSAWQNRRRFVHSLATLDSQVILDGGWLLSMGQEDSLRDLVAVYRQLPAMRMEKVIDPSDPAAGQPVTLRVGSRGDRTYAYLVNDAPFPTAVEVAVETPAGCRLEALPGLPSGTLRQDAGATIWGVALGPYDVVAATFSGAGVRLSCPKTTWSGEVQSALRKRIDELGARAAALGSRPALEVLENPGFDRSPGPQGQIPGWTAAGGPGVTIQLDPAAKHSGSFALHLASSGPPAKVTSRPFVPPATGRLWMLVRLRVADEGRQPPLRVCLEGKAGHRTFVRYAQFGQSPGDQRAPPITTQWSRPFVVHADDLPLEPQTPMRISFELAGAGEVWIDDVQLSGLAFSQEERKELVRLIAPANVKREDGQVSDCIRLLEGYWPRFLVEHVPLAETPATPREAPPPKPEPEPRRSTGFLDRVRSLIPERLRF